MSQLFASDINKSDIVLKSILMLYSLKIGLVCVYHILVAYEICIYYDRYTNIFNLYIPNVKSKVLSYTSFKLVVKFNFACL